MRIIRLVDQRAGARERRRQEPPVRRRRDLAEKGWAPLRYWVLWWTLIGIADVALLRHPDADLDGPARHRMASRPAFPRTASRPLGKLTRLQRSQPPPATSRPRRGTGVGRHVTAQAPPGSADADARSCEERTGSARRGPKTLHGASPGFRSTAPPSTRCGEPCGAGGAAATRAWAGRATRSCRPLRGRDRRVCRDTRRRSPSRLRRRTARPSGGARRPSPPSNQEGGGARRARGRGRRGGARARARASSCRSRWPTRRDASHGRRRAASGSSPAGVTRYAHAPGSLATTSVGFEPS